MKQLSTLHNDKIDNNVLQYNSTTWNNLLINIYVHIPIYHTHLNICTPQNQ